MRLALLVPMRGQPIRRELFWYTFQRTRKATPVQLIVRVDDDDADTAAWVREHTDAELLIGPRFEGYRSLPRYFNEMVRKIHPETTAIMCGNDDCRYETEDWAGYFVRAARRYASGIFNLGCMTFPAGAFPFSTVGPKLVETLGYLNREDLIYQDIFLRDVHARLGCCQLLPRVTILHIGQAAADAIGVKETADRAYWQRHADAVSEVVDRLRPIVTRRSVGWTFWRREVVA